MTQPYITRSEASAPPADLVRIMAHAVWDIERAGTSLPGLDGILPAHAAKVRDGVVAALRAAEAAGLITINSRSAK